MPDHVITPNEKICLVGAGPMAVEYARVMQTQSIDFEVVGRSEKSAAEFHEQTGVQPETGGLTRWIENRSQGPHTAIVAVNETDLADATKTLIESGTRRILVEKPGALSIDQLGDLARVAHRHEVAVYVAYNRRYYASTLAAEQIIKEDGGITSFQFEFTEWSHRIVELPKPPQELAEWFFLNSTHVVDLAFHLGGWPTTLNCHASGGLAWHPQASIFCGSGVSEKGALFSYNANWEAPGRWGVEWLTRRHRLVLRPLEELRIQTIGSIDVTKMEIDDELDRQFKPGLYRQVAAFLTHDDAIRLPTIETHYHHASAVARSMIEPQREAGHRRSA